MHYIVEYEKQYLEFKYMILKSNIWVLKHKFHYSDF